MFKLGFDTDKIITEGDIGCGTSSAGAFASRWICVDLWWTHNPGALNAPGEGNSRT